LISHKISIEAIPPDGTFLDGVAFLRDKHKFLTTCVEAAAWAKAAVLAVKTAAEPNPWKDSSDEEIAEEILRRVEDKKRRTKRTDEAR